MYLCIDNISIYMSIYVYVQLYVNIYIYFQHTFVSLLQIECT